MKPSDFLVFVFITLGASEKLWTKPVDTTTYANLVGTYAFSDGEKIYTGAYANVNDDSIVPVKLTLNDWPNYPTNLTLNPDSSDASWSNRIVGYPKSGGSGIVLLDPDTDTTNYYTSFWPYQNMIFINPGSSGLSYFTSYEYAVPSDIEGVYNLEFWASGKPNTDGSAKIIFKMVQ